MIFSDQFDDDLCQPDFELLNLKSRLLFWTEQQASVATIVSAIFLLLGKDFSC